MHTYMFRNEGTPQIPHSLFVRVRAAMTELEREGGEHHLQMLGMHDADDSSGEMVLSKVSGTYGWHYHVSPLLAKHGVKCASYCI